MDPAQPLNFTHWLADILPTAGVGGVLAMVMFYFYRLDAERNMKKFDEIVTRQEKASEGWIRIVQDNTSALVKIGERLDRPAR